MKKSHCILPAILLISTPAPGGEARVDGGKILCTSAGCNIQVTLKHADTGWDHYANKWDVLTVDGRLIATRVLYHPHVNEQPFTRSLSGVKIPLSESSVIVRGHDSKHGYGGEQLRVEIQRH